MPEKPLFRQKAIMAYKRNMEKDVVLRFISWPIILCLWLLLGILLVAGFFAWYAQVPTYVSGSGVLLTQGEGVINQAPTPGEVVAIVFLPPDQSAHLRAGLPVDLQVGSTGLHVQSTIAQVEPDIMSPDAIRQRYQLNGADALLITEPARVVLIKPGTALPITAYAGSTLTARIETGSQRLLTLLFGSGQFLGSSS